MDKLITNLDTNLGPVLREQLDSNFQKIQNGVDGQADSLNKQILNMLGPVAPQNQNEVTQARIDANGNAYETLKGREDATQKTAETALSEERTTRVEVQTARSDSSGNTYGSLSERMNNQEVTLTNNINAKISQISSVPETFANLSALQATYPNGKTGLFVTADTGHKYIWSNGAWIDAGVYQAVGIAYDSIVSKNVNYVTPRNIRDTFANDKGVFGWNGPTSFSSNKHVINFTGKTGNSGVLIPVDLPNGVSYTDELFISFTYSTSRVDTPATTFGWMLAQDNGAFFNTTAKIVITTQTLTKTKVTQTFNLKNLGYTNIPSHFNILVAIGSDFSVEIDDLYVNKSGVDTTLDTQLKTLNSTSFTNNSVDFSKGFSNWGGSTIATTKLNDGSLLVNNTVTSGSSSPNGGIRYTVPYDTNTDLYITAKTTTSSDSDFGINLINDTGALVSLKSNEFLNADGVFEGYNGIKSYFIKKDRLKSLGFSKKSIGILFSISGTNWFTIEQLSMSPKQGFANDKETNNYQLANTTLRPETKFGQSPRLLSLSATTPTSTKYTGLDLATPSNAPKYGYDVYLKEVEVYSDIDTTVSFAIGTIDQNGLLVNVSRTWSQAVVAGFNNIRYERSKVIISNGQRLFMKVSDTGIYPPTTDAPLFSKSLIRDNTHYLNDGTYNGYMFFETDKIVPMRYTVTEKNIGEKIKDASDDIQQLNDDVASLLPLKKNLSVVSPNGTKYIIFVDDNGNLLAKSNIPQEVVVVGNSLTYNWGNFGLAASNPGLDWYALTKAYIANANPNAKFTRFGFGDWEGATTTADRDTIFNTKMKPSLTANTDLVIIQLGDNINSDAKNATFGADAKKLIQNIKAVSPKATVIWVATWYQSYGNITTDVEAATKATGSIYVPIHHIPFIKGTSSYIGAVQTDADGNTRVIDSDGRASHPGDKGHQLIAEAVIRSFDF